MATTALKIHVCVCSRHAVKLANTQYRPTDSDCCCMLPTEGEWSHVIWQYYTNNIEQTSCSTEALSAVAFGAVFSVSWCQLNVSITYSWASKVRWRLLSLMHLPSPTYSRSLSHVACSPCCCCSIILHTENCEISHSLQVPVTSARLSIQKSDLSTGVIQPREKEEALHKESLFQRMNGICNDVTASPRRILIANFS